MSSLSSFADRFAKPPRQPQMKRPVHLHLTASVIKVFAAFPLLSSSTVIAAVPTTRQAPGRDCAGGAGAHGRRARRTAFAYEVGGVEETVRRGAYVEDRGKEDNHESSRCLHGLHDGASTASVLTGTSPRCSFVGARASRASGSARRKKVCKGQ